MVKKNSFREETHFLFLEDNYWKCWWCGQNHANCGHHILGRGKTEGCEKSPFNYAPLSNHFCHLPNHGKLMTDEGKKAMLEKTIAYLSEREYTLTKEDEDFLTKYDLEFRRLKVRI